jgi:hypothetical protein
MSEKPKELQLQIQIDDEQAQGTYVNMATVSFTETEFILDWIYVQPQQPRGKVRSRIITSPRHAKRLLAALGDSVRRYEQRFGTLDPASLPDFDLN